MEGGLRLANLLKYGANPDGSVAPGPYLPAMVVGYQLHAANMGALNPVVCDEAKKACKSAISINTPPDIIGTITFHGLGLSLGGLAIFGLIDPNIRNESPSISYPIPLLFSALGTFLGISIVNDVTERSAQANQSNSEQLYMLKEIESLAKTDPSVPAPQIRLIGGSLKLSQLRLPDHPLSPNHQDTLLFPEVFKAIQELKGNEGVYLHWDLVTRDNPSRPIFIRE